jgi:hypothetical protein
MTEAYEKLAKQLRLIQTSVNTANDMAAQLLRSEEQLFEQHLNQILTEKPPPLPMPARELYRHIKKWLHLHHGYRPDEREVAAGLKALGWTQQRISSYLRWMPPNLTAPSSHEPPDPEQQQDQ